ncbi:tyrosine--tRNA ligase [Polymorphobacter fuscus]|uniref:Tyrosine--tRNA ligase n=1 Tax=Sandarakinorhabdus fusca TaxID=1439888 RepID=A0A7C9KKD2_9SPHN|nr:tyrosine--tRNA ligase [Polymorphobacter fuscus]KAB7648822.1 tyrosine--tRNA ligase [Polymorphobacter fuscus]MQT16403.1 tyrosine--tRNA ligase [Polymorphobacter fuscus]NJC07308.1 tyrosyl-tRNA synthetase [Polymorphobacter fuscus]
MAYTSDFLRRLDTRGFIHQITDPAALDAAASAGVVTAYVGYDCTAPSLHIGNLVSIMMLRHFQQSGHRPIVLMGGGTTKVGDPSGKDEGRQMLDDARIEANKASIRRIFERFLDFDGPNAAIMVDNDEWLSGLAYIPFLREIGRHFSVNRMLSFDSVKLRLDREQPLSFLEFNYMILQGYDYLELNRRFGCILQMGGSDQWGNIVNGTDLIRRVDGRDAFGLTTPLITRADGAKMGKTAAGAVWLHEDSLPGFDYWQFWRNTHDADVARFLKIYTDLELGAIEEVLAGDINAAKVVLATEATALCRGRPAAEAAAATAAATFAGGAGDDLPRFAIDAPVSILDALIGLGFAASKGEARRLVAGGGARIDGAPVTNDAELVSAGSRISAGKKRHGIIDLR